MALDNVGDILNIGSLGSSYKLLLIQGIQSRPAYSPMFRALLRPFVGEGQVAVSYRCHNRILKSFVRMSELQSDFCSVRELAVGDVYRLDPDFHPDLIIDGGGNIGMFSLRAAALLQTTGDADAKIIVCEPVPANIERIRKHLELNRIDAEIRPVCLGGSAKTIPFYCREANQGSFDPAKPYASAMQIPVFTLQEIIGDSSAERILIKLDIEGMEVETLSAFLPGEKRAVYVVGELHEFSKNAPLLEQLFRENGWTLQFHGIADDLCTFRGCSPAARPLLPSLAAAS